ncbi:MAG TPA: histidine kinase [Terriglobales bacterium]|nr:histidine kinase [Terriglobales bacterium]
MHPLFVRMRNLGLYLLAWSGPAVILAYLFKASGGLRWTEAVALSFPLCLIYAFDCLAAWYPCKVTPLEQSGFLRLVLTHLTAAALMSLVWVGIARVLAFGLERWAGFSGLSDRLAANFALLWTSGVLLYILSVTFHYVLLAEQTAREAQARALEARVLARDAELKALRAQVNPHFLFNCLHSISALTSSDSAKAREMCILLADFLRATLRLGGKETIPLEDELTLIRGYLAIEKVRFGARLRMEEDVQNETGGLLIPPLLLQPLVENAIRHGIANLPEGGVIRLGVHRREQSVAIEVENSFDPDSPSSMKTGVGLENIRQRLHTRYAEQANIVAGAEGNRFLVTLHLPAQANGARA